MRAGISRKNYSRCFGHSAPSSDGGGSKAENAQGIGKLIKITGWIARFNQFSGEDTDDSDLINEAFEVGGFYTGEATNSLAAAIEAVFEGIGVAEGCTGAAMGGE